MGSAQAQPQVQKRNQGHGRSGISCVGEGVRIPLQASEYRLQTNGEKLPCSDNLLWRDGSPITLRAANRLSGALLLPRSASLSPVPLLPPRSCCYWERESQAPRIWLCSAAGVCGACGCLTSPPPTKVASRSQASPARAC